MNSELIRIACNLASELVTQPELEGKSFVLSPRSIHSALALLCLGAEGPTREELLAFLGCGSEDELRATLSADEARRPDSPLSSAVGLFVQPGSSPRPEFVDLARDLLSARIEQLAFSEPSAAQRINQWVAEATSGRITRIVSALDPAGVMLLLSALHFRADWAAQFNPQATFDQPFSLRTGQSVQRPAMHITGTYPTSLGADWHLLEMGYRQSDYAMVVALPTNPQSTLLDAGALTAGIAALQPALVQLQLPRFDVSADLSLTAALRRAGVRRAFDAAEADFSRITSDRLYATGVLHKAVVAVTEEGTEAAAVTAVPLARSRDLRPKVPFVVNRPFWFALRDRGDGALLFVGRVEDPKG